ncbi:glycosyltransferase [Priestia aryabhattai]|uniref:glycosyltransferase n=1 Tax=Priestia aryabhattai TaxID=412384 RepID=UPI0015F5D5DA|nr:glycosyltransferase [Priestia aryabhattai]MBZ6484005.1 glycosyltransferase [Priestia aryabhattai]
MSKVSIVIPFYNCSYIDQAIESALNQTYQNIEVIVVNDGSDKFTEKVTPYLNRIRYIEKENGGTASALNVGVKNATGNYFAWLSSDDIFLQDKIERQLTFMQQTNSYISYTNYSLIDADSNVVHKSAGVHFPFKIDFLQNLRKGCNINGCTVMMKMEVFSVLGLFSEELRFTQDYDFWLRAVQHYEFYYLDENLVHYRVHSEMGTKKFDGLINREIESLNQRYESKLTAMINQEQSKKIRFVFPILTLCKGGAQRMLADISNGLVERGHNVTIVMPPQGDIEYDIIAKVLRTKHAILSEKDYPQGDIIVSNFYSTVSSAQQASQNGKGTHVRFSLCYEPVFLPDQDISFQSYNQTPHLIVISEYQKDLISLLHGINGKTVPIYVNPNFRDLNIRSENNPLTISAIIRKPEGGYSWQRDQSYLIEQLRIVRKKYPQLKFNLISPPNEMESSLSLKQLRKSGEFHFYTPANDTELCYYYNQADIFITSSIFETAVLPGLEAMKCGAALVAVYAGGNTEYCRHEETCLLSYRYENRLALDISRLIEDQNLRKELTERGKQEAELWNIKKTVSAFEDICYSCLNRNL